MLWDIFVLMWVFLCQQCHLTRDASFCSSDLQFNVENHEQDMIGRMTTLLPAEKQQISRNILPRRDTFEVLYHLHFDNLCAGRVLGYISSVIFQACPWYSMYYWPYQWAALVLNRLPGGHSFPVLSGTHSPPKPFHGKRTKPTETESRAESGLVTHSICFGLLIANKLLVRNHWTVKKAFTFWTTTRREMHQSKKAQHVDLLTSTY